ncbi:Methyltransferase type 11 domain-containing protein [Candidatus Magnetomoraceae bacterium gMMP-1]
MFNRIILWKLGLLVRLWRKNNRYSNPRLWSNDELKKFADLFVGDVINISAGQDKDKENRTYRDYFSKANSYTISNYKRLFNNSNLYNEIELDLNVPLPIEKDIISRFDVVFSHTVLEHVYDVKIAIKNLCKLSKDIVITIVPYIQSFHHEEGIYNDYWRLSPYAISNLFSEHSFKTIYISWNNDPIGNIYIFHIASKCPDRWCNIINMNNMNNNFGPGYYRQLLLSNTDNCPNVKITKDDLILSKS